MGLVKIKGRLSLADTKSLLISRLPVLSPSEREKTKTKKKKPLIIEIIPAQGFREAPNDMYAYTGITKLAVDLLIFGMLLPLITVPSK